MRWSTLQEVQSKMEDFSGNFLSYTSVSLGSGNQNTGSRACAQAPSKECFPCLFKKQCQPCTHSCAHTASLHLRESGLGKTPCSTPSEMRQKLFRYHLGKLKSFWILCQSVSIFLVISSSTLYKAISSQITELKTNIIMSKDTRYFFTFFKDFIFSNDRVAGNLSGE